MISQVTGVLIEAIPSAIVVDVHGVGFEMGISGTTAAALPPVGDQLRIFTRMVVREDSCTLFGFATKDERSMFDRLVAVSGVGAKLALAILSTFDVAQLYAVVMSEDHKEMAKVPGVGKKTAQRLILELKSVFAKDASLSAMPLPQPAMLPLDRAAASNSAVVEDATAALMSMGFTPAEVSLALSDLDSQQLSVEDLLSTALKRLGMNA